MKTNDFQGELTDISAKKEALVTNALGVQKPFVAAKTRC